jgi:acyl-[acyl-carrier-protein]-phospholipid O-acyltransferase/long-chain-fatty-acid--[acyl-carrier-protein] ligase
MQITENPSLGRCFISVARKNWHSRCIADLQKSLSYSQTLTAAIALSRKIDSLAAGHDKIAILLSPSIAAVLANLAVTLSGKTMVNLNYTLSSCARLEAIRQCDIKYVISSRQFLKRARIDEHFPAIVFIEDLISSIKPIDKFKAYLKAGFIPVKFLTKRENKIAAVIFSSGTTGTPKGVMLSHYNILSNINSIRKIIHITHQDNFCVVLPFFHSFGFTCGFWLPLIAAASAVYAANPFDATEVGTNARLNNSTILFAPPTFLSHYIKRIDIQDFAGLRLVVAGAEKLKKQIADSFEAKFGIRPLQGYGTTELSPAVSLNFPGVNKEDTVGRPLPDVEVKIVDLDTGRTAKQGQTGLIMVKGPNVMAGYLNMPQETAEVLKDGWYNTGDIGCVDEDSFLTITGRLSRFSKIAGEMVPHIAVEEVFLNALGTTEQLVAVTAIPDEKKGEELIVFYLPQAGTAENLHEIITKSNLPNIWKPRRDNYIKIELMPTLGSGKLDVAKLKEIALSSKKTENNFG